jgi:hypothetical protein
MPQLERKTLLLIPALDQENFEDPNLIRIISDKNFTPQMKAPNALWYVNCLVCALGTPNAKLDTEVKNLDGLAANEHKNFKATLRSFGSFPGLLELLVKLESFPVSGEALTFNRLTSLQGVRTNIVSSQ